MRMDKCWISTHTTYFTSDYTYYTRVPGVIAFKSQHWKPREKKKYIIFQGARDGHS